jgi:transposase
LGLDKGYDADNLRKELRKRRIVPNATYRKNRLDKPVIGRPPKDKQEKKYCRQRWKVERTFSWTNNNRRLDRLLECQQTSYRTFVRIYIIKHYLKLLC